ncbi:hypothetical protein C1H46_030414 [Malus baccata]|uniref:Uncharacterized protein n=1 Tax=Malus baccata TaxID=106549 RepID=A0A540LC38_MALBA|nr:hypothetical protein C1H46_030414 [Malus baccata]
MGQMTLLHWKGTPPALLRCVFPSLSKISPRRPRQVSNIRWRNSLRVSAWRAAGLRSRLASRCDPVAEATLGF